MNFQKNQTFIIDLVPKILKIIPNAVVVLVGDGSDREELEKKIKKMNLSSHVLLVGQQNEMQGWYSAFDVLLFPSLFEGLSVALLEAQASGVPILASNNVQPEEVKINSNFWNLSLNDSKDKWIKKLSSIAKINKRESEKSIENNFLKKDYEIKNAAKKLQKEFLKGR